MSFLAGIRIALRALRVNALRSLLAMLGVIIGVASILVMQAIGAGARESVDRQIRALGTNVISVWPGSAVIGGRRAGLGTGLPFSSRDVAAIVSSVPGVAHASGQLGGTTTFVFEGTNWVSTVFGVDVDYLEVRDWSLAEGRGFTLEEQRAGAKVVILGATIAEELFGGTPAVGETIRIKNVPFEVIGILAVKGPTMMGGDQDDLALVPITTVRSRLFGIGQAVPDRVGSFIVEAAPEADVNSIQAEIVELLRARRRIPEGVGNDFVVRNMTEFIRARAATLDTLGMLLGATAGISLVVGGIGIMNIMLVSVTERTREIGLRMAVGARRRDIMTQFLAEAVTLCVAGGGIGLVLGVGATIALSKLGAWPVTLDPLWMALAVAFAGVVGVVFGFYPARRAARLNPIEALRHE